MQNHSISHSIYLVYLNTNYREICMVRKSESYDSPTTTLREGLVKNKS